MTAGLQILAAAAALIGISPLAYGESDLADSVEAELKRSRELVVALHDHLVAYRNAVQPEQGTSSEPLTDLEGTLPAEEFVLEADKNGDCFSHLWALVRRETGSDCNSYQAEISAWSSKCVTKCDTPARMREANAKAAAECAAFCKRKRCPGPRYAPVKKCAASKCFRFPDSPDCSEKWPLKNYCSTLDTQRVFNCECLEI